MPLIAGYAYYKGAYKGRTAREYTKFLQKA